MKLQSRALENEIHATAVIHPMAKLGAGIKVGPYSVIGENVTLGDGCEVGCNVLIEGRTRIGSNNVFFHGASIGTIPQDLKYSGDITYVEIGDDNIFREFVTVNCATREGEKTLIGSGCLFMAYAHVAHNCTIGNEVILANSVNLAGHVFIDDYAIVGGVTPVHQFVRIGKLAFIGGGSRIERDIPPFIKVAGNPARVYGINGVGLERRGYEPERCSMIKRMFKVLYRSNLNVAQSVQRLKDGEFSDPERRIFVEFIEGSIRGITK
ncbi:MAG: acyl-ACP--UDP-N-acetylglucosamine O-acyltransferase [Candidatus Latescibacteria bacterium]|nr:acyl-ACP--UDP-N-acetylglucosamine O-acyltransferase [Candidatus Latescibacterota bacterium]NIM20942.1 acyl-ACP--UDP-N-acetylglucosamine O-acyltransferase [Candidatus Latescibacterota bacterium]NIM65077.1 acyl-ACP--UDP-N-acetylglucosamine O-acyltransferase [Candidatus Latescibacterota bacterium]NIO01592.1 acyl-ACP--UDP-N-acetylglucosamine O-acyltransferase [Candidatus Latescibacterota bacterium]NIO28109.1 acyl-ACP--UDP-N-acetylglucosamine O-acyltransferase [Candidatus Latescibacterota bacteri